MRTFKNPSRQPKLIPLRSGTISVPGRATFEIQDDDYSVQVKAMVARGEILEETPVVAKDLAEVPVAVSDSLNHMDEVQTETKDITSVTTDKDELVEPGDNAEDSAGDVSYADLTSDSGDADSLTMDENRGELEEGKDIIDDSIKEPDVRLGRKAKKRRRG